MKLTWSPVAVTDRESIFDYIAADSVSAAIDLDELFQAKATLVAEQPQMGRRGRVQGTRELVVTPITSSSMTSTRSASVFAF